MAKLKSELVIAVTDRASKQAAAIGRNVQKMQDSVLHQQRSIEQARGQMLDAVAVGYVAYRAISAPIEAAVEFQAQLEGIRQKAALTRTELAKLGRQSREIGLSTAQGAGAITGAIDTLLGSGAVTPEQAIAVADALGRAASAYNASPDDLANATAALIGNMGIAASEMEKTFDIMSQGGKEGKFELKDMAAEFPGLTAGAKALGIEGTKGVADLVAALEVAASGAASGSEAANNMANYMRKVLAPDSIKKFGAAGIDIVKEMNDAVKDGVSPMERSLDIIGKLTEGGKQELLGKYFADAQVQQFLLPLLQNMEEYKRIRQEAIDADGVVANDYKEWLSTPGGAIERFNASIENLNLAVGSSLLPKLTEFINAVTPMIDGVAKFTDANQNLVAAIVQITAALVGLRILAAAGGFAKAFMGGGSIADLMGLPGNAALAGKPGNSNGGARGSGIVDAAGKAISLYELAKVAADNGMLKGPDLSKGWQQGLVEMLDPGLARRIYEPEPAPVKTQADYADEIGGMQTEIARLKAEIAAVPPPAFDGAMDTAAPLRQNLALLEQDLSQLETKSLAAGSSAGAAIGDGIASQAGKVSTDFGVILRNLQSMAAAGVMVDVHTRMNAAAGLPQPVQERKFARGGRVSGAGTGTSDSIPADLSDGEFVVNAAAAGEHGALLEAINAGYFPAGGREQLPGRGAVASASRGPITIHLGGVTVQGTHDPERVADVVLRRINEKLGDALSGIHADIEYAG